MCKFLIRRKQKIEQSGLTNHLDDFLFAALTKLICDASMQQLLDMCDNLGVLVSLEKMESTSCVMIFLGILLDSRYYLLAIPEEKRLQAINILQSLMDRMKELQRIAGLLNFFNRAIVLGQAFTRRMYAKFSGFVDKNGNKVRHAILKQHHHMHLDAEFKADCSIWLQFLMGCHKGICRLFIDARDNCHTSETPDFYTDAAKGFSLGAGGVFGAKWFFLQWEPNFIKSHDPTIEYLELYALRVEILCWSQELRNRRITVFCDNQAVVSIVNNTSTKCKNSMILIRMLVL